MRTLKKSSKTQASDTNLTKKWQEKTMLKLNTMLTILTEANAEKKQSTKETSTKTTLLNIEKMTQN
jgi:uracil DNA glycosylase